MKNDLSNNFSYEEMFISKEFPELARKAYEVKQNNKELKLKFKILCLNGLQPLRDYINKPIKIISGYRDEYLNKAIGGSDMSDHIFGMAADLTCDYDLYKLFKWATENLCYRQIIYYPEQNFIHISANWFAKDYKHVALVKVNGKYLQAKEYFVSKA